MNSGRGQLRRMFDRFAGKCIYCEGGTWMPGNAENWKGAQRRLGISRDQYSSANAFKGAYNKTQAEVDCVKSDDGRIEAVMGCNYCVKKRDGRAVADHKKLMMEMVAGGIHPTNRVNWPSLQQNKERAA